MMAKWTFEKPTIHHVRRQQKKGFNKIKKIYLQLPFNIHKGHILFKVCQAKKKEIKKNKNK